MTRKYIFIAITLLFLLTASFSASAATVEFQRYHDYDVGGYTNVILRTGTGWYGEPLYTYYDGEFAGMYGFKRTGGDFDETLLPTTPAYGGSLFRAFCLDVTERYFSNYSSVEQLSDLFSSDPSKASDIGRLLYNAYPDFAVTPNSYNALATQIAIWEIVHEGTGTYDVDSGDILFDEYYIHSAWHGAKDLAQTWLDSYVTGMTGPEAPFLYALVRSGTQPLLVQTPIPASVWLFSSAFAGLVGFSRRRNKRS